MAFDFNGTNQYMTATPPQRGWTAMTAACRFWRDSTTGDQKLFAVWDDSGNKYEWLLALNASGAGVAIVDAAGTEAAVIASSAASKWSSGQWQHAAMTFSGTAIFCFLNGAQEATLAAASPIDTSTGLLSLAAGLNGASPSGQVDGKTCEFALWSAALTSDEIAALAKGFSPNRVRPQSLKFYAPLVRNVSDLKAGATITQYNSPSVFAHPRIYR